MKLFTKDNECLSVMNECLKKVRISLFGKLGNLTNQGDNSARIGNFLSSTARSVGLHPIAGLIDGGVNAIHNIKNNLEKNINK
jgi:hypothetical protein